MNHSDILPKKDPADWSIGGQRIFYQNCEQCQSSWYYFRPFCPSCGVTGSAPIASTGMGVVESKTILHRAPDAFFREFVPYCLVLVRLEEGVVLMAHADLDVEINDQVIMEAKKFHEKTVPYFKKKSLS
jgi:uncharacterized protein